jgi:predicted translin family RNA/ssDNA-binding protein
MIHLQLLEKQEQVKPKRNKRKEIIKIRVEINELETKIIIQWVNKTKGSSLKKINKIDKPLTKLNKRRKEKTLINKI